MKKFHRHFYTELPSTQSFLKEWVAFSALPEGTLIWTLYQTAGYGRAGNPWYATPGESLTLSFLLHPPTEKVPLLTAISALALYEAVSPHLHAPLYFKWPNDLWVFSSNHSGKLAGILAEAIHNGCVIIGIGLNVYQRYFPPELSAISLRQAGYSPLTLEEILDQFEQAFWRWYATHPSKIRADFVKHLYPEIPFRFGDKILRAQVEAWDDEGYLHLRAESQLWKIPASQAQVVWNLHSL
ncbi:MAG: biotin--[acetyl-CoA-carboxylase] ligase [Bacteroidia bacterium]|nr:biotin--[acetyl-CoA-carboxylase] ligase [Bacteroidia bacterium]MDW8235785.1 biotin--[acetyl-CoA-carboxylase] ligase [Bacteroidia bacterium]